MAKVRIVVNKHNIKHNLRNEDKRPVLSIQSSKPTVWTDEIVFVDSEGVPVGRLVYRPDNGLHCGATVWFETDDDNIQYFGAQAADYREEVCEIGTD